MTSYLTTDIDKEALPDELLEPTKEHLRIDFPDDDDSIKRYLSWSIGYIQHFTGLQIFSAKVTFNPAGGGVRATVPVQPISSTFTAADANGPVTSDYVVRATGMTGPVYLVRVDGDTIPAGVVFNLDAGYDSADALDPALYGNILRLAATMYEHRESVTTMSMDEIPSWANDMLTGLWIPRA